MRTFFMLVRDRKKLGFPPLRFELRYLVLLTLIFVLFLNPTGFADESALKNRDGTWKWTNHLIDETSPYLQRHAHNPVDWYPWTDEALARAKTENRLIFLSIGYSTCYWCHVMERRVFSNPEIAAQMNEHFINIKIDREERPDLDEIYMTATQLLTGKGGWPTSVFLTPDLEPFYAGTYFPPTDMPGKPGFPTILTAVHEAWVTRPSEVVDAAKEIVTAIENTMNQRFTAAVSKLPEHDLIDAAVQKLKESYHHAYGGFGDAPKFPSPANLEFLLGKWESQPEKPTGRTDESLRKMITLTLDMMAYGGIYDQLGGGFHRYSVDEKWRVPHFEKMLYDNAQLAKSYLRGYEFTQKSRYKRIATEIFEFVARELTSPEGGFYSAIDAETDAEEGKYYVWTAAEIDEILTEQNGQKFKKVYGIDRGANFEGKNVLYVPSGIDEKQLEAVAFQRERLLAARALRQRPLMDTKILVSWNGLMIDALAYGYQVLRDERYRHAAQKAAEFILTKLRHPDGGLARTYTAGHVKYDGYLVDYAFFVRGLLGLYEATAEDVWLREAEALTDMMIQRFWDDKNSAFYFTQADAQNLIVRTKNPYDSAVPSGNAVAVSNLLTLSKRLSTKNYRQRAEQTFIGFSGAMEQYPTSFMYMLSVLNGYLSERGEVPKLMKTALPEYVTATASARATGQIFEVELNVKIAEGWHINANPPSQPILIPTAVTVGADASVVLATVKYPQGTTAHFSFSDDALTVYEGDVTIAIQLRRKPNKASDTGAAIILRLTYQPCNDTQCLLPNVLEIPVTLPEE